MTIEALLAKYGLVALFLGAGLEGETVVVTGGLLAHRGIVPLPGAMAATAVGSFVADQLFFSAGRYFRRSDWVARMHRRALFARALALFERHPIGFIFAFRFLYGLRTISPVAIGTTRVPARLFATVNAVAAVVWAVAFTTLGYVFGHRVEQTLARLLPDRHAVVVAGLCAAGIAALGIAAHWLWNRRAAS